MSDPITYFAIERSTDPDGRWIELIRYATVEEARMNAPDAARHPQGILVRVVKVTKEVV